MTPGTRTRTIIDYSDLSKVKPEKSLLRPKPKNAGRNNRGVITVRHRGGGHKQKYRKIDFLRNKFTVAGKVATIASEPNPTPKIELSHNYEGKKKYIRALIAI